MTSHRVVNEMEARRRRSRGIIAVVVAGGLALMIAMAAQSVQEQVEFYMLGLTFLMLG